MLPSMCMNTMHHSIDQDFALDDVELQWRQRCPQSSRNLRQHSQNSDGQLLLTVLQSLSDRRRWIRGVGGGDGKAQWFHTASTNIKVASGEGPSMASLGFEQACRSASDGKCGR